METTKTIIKNAIKYLTTPGHMQTFIHQLADADWYKVITNDSTGNDVFDCAVDRIIYIFAVDYKNKEVHFLDESLDSNNKKSDNIQKIKGFIWDKIPSESISNPYKFLEHKPNLEYTCSISLQDLYNDRSIYSGSVSTLDTVTVTYCNTIDEIDKIKTDKNNSSQKYSSVSTFDKIKDRYYNQSISFSAMLDNIKNHENYLLQLSDSTSPYNGLILNNKNCIDKMYVCHIDNKHITSMYGHYSLETLYDHQKYVLDCLNKNKNVIISKGRQIGITQLLVNYAMFSKYRVVNITCSDSTKCEHVLERLLKIISTNGLLKTDYIRSRYWVASAYKLIKVNTVADIKKNDKNFEYIDTLCIFDDMASYDSMKSELLDDILVKSKQTIIASTPAIDSSFNDIYKNRFDMFKINLPKNGVTVNDIASVSPNIISNEFNAIVQ